MSQPLGSLTQDKAQAPRFYLGRETTRVSLRFRLKSLRAFFDGVVLHWRQHDKLAHLALPKKTAWPFPSDVALTFSAGSFVSEMWCEVCRF